MLSSIGIFRDSSVMNDKKYHTGHRKRLREKLLRSKQGTMMDYEILEILLFSVKPLGDVRYISHALLEKFHNFYTLVNASNEELLAMPVVNENVLSVIRVLREALQRTLHAQIREKTVLSDWKSLVDYLRLDIGGKEIENFRILYLDNQYRLIADDLQDMGTVNQTPMYIREIIKRALALSVTNIIISHNHPSGDPNPSDADIKMTRRLSLACNAVDLHLTDHIIVTNEKYYSFRNNGLLL